jgi:hypothetical protein
MPLTTSTATAPYNTHLRGVVHHARELELDGCAGTEAATAGGRGPDSPTGRRRRVEVQYEQQQAVAELHRAVHLAVLHR